MSRDELAVIDGDKCILQLRGVCPFFSSKFDITKHKRYKELSDFDEKYPHKEKGEATTEYSRMYNKERYKFFLEAPFEISENCCNVMKKRRCTVIQKGQAACP